MSASTSDPTNDGTSDRTNDRIVTHGGDEEARRWVCAAALAAATKTDDEIVVLQVGEVLGITGYFLICSGRNSRQVRTLAEEIERLVREAGGPKPRQVEGLDGLQWVLLDYGDFVVHVFLDETRRFYELERLWADVPRVEWRAVADPSSVRHTDA